MQPLRLLTLTTLLAFLTACGNDTSSPADPTDTGLTDTHVDATPSSDALTDTQADTDDPTITISGRVVSSLGAPVAGAQVGLLPGSVTTTDADGHFTFADVEPPYDIVTITRRGAPDAILHRGLTRPDPSLFHYTFSETLKANIGVQVTGGLFNEPSPPAFNTQVSFVPTSANAPSHTINYGQSTDASGAADLDVFWLGSQTTEGRFVALQWETDANDLPVTYTGFGFSPTTTISSGDMLTDVRIALDQPVDDTSVDISISSPSEFFLARAFPLASFRGVGGLNLSSASSSPFTLVAPVADSLDIQLFTEIRSKRGPARIIRRLDTDVTTSNTLDLDVDQLRGMLNPPNNAGDIQPGYQFSWEAAPDDITLLMIRVDRSGGITDDLPTLRIVTQDTQLSLPDLSSFGFALEPDTDYLWRTFNISSFDHIDQATTLPFANIASVAGGFSSAEFLATPFELHIDAPPRTFRTAP